ncbi:DNA -binding domain-containing protein [Pelagibacterium halotolerans]|uniref:DNA -binding domain-containing protein n=1 Tax=Pelagibacterium halotolerans TaxID=531813 RepID=UPI00384C4CD2
MTQVDFLDEPPECAMLTDYDRSHMKLYLRILDATRDGADWREIADVLFGLNADEEPERARRVINSHLARARWMTTHGYRLLVREGQQH